MTPLPEERYGEAAPALREVAVNHLFARSVVERHVRGRVCVDDETEPRSFHVLHPYGMSLLFGEVGDGFLRDGLVPYLTGADGRREKTEWLQVFPPALEARIDEALGDRLATAGPGRDPSPPPAPVVKHRRVNFAFDPGRYRRFRRSIDLGALSFAAVDEDLFEVVDGSVVPRRFWDDAAGFRSRGVGFALLAEGEAASVAFSSFRHDPLVELGMETRPRWRRKGLAAAVTAKLIDHCLEKGLEPVWACRLGNEGSFRLAVRLGFQPGAVLPYYELRAPRR
jgi:GNAT superfamily N-acetyltransferase